MRNILLTLRNKRATNKRELLSIALRGLSALILVFFAMTSICWAKTVQVKIQDMAFVPAQVSADVGDTVEWSNEDFVLHSATAKNGAWDIKIPPNTTQKIVLKDKGTTAYYCRYHPTMKAEIKSK